jgi:hypothetical protein
MYKNRYYGGLQIYKNVHGFQILNFSKVSYEFKSYLKVPQNHTNIMATYRAWNFNQFTHDFIENSLKSLSILSVDSISIISSCVRFSGSLCFLSVAYILKLICKACGGVDISMELNLDLDISAISKYFLQTISDFLYLSVLWVFVLSLLVTTFLIGALCFLVHLAGMLVRMIESVHIARRISSVATTFRYMRGYVTSQCITVIPWKWERKMLDTHSPSELDIYHNGEIHYIVKGVVYQRLEGEWECISYTVHVHEEEENAKSPEYDEVRAEMANKDGKTADVEGGKMATKLLRSVFFVLFMFSVVAVRQLFNQL